MKYYLVAGEASGDQHGSNLMKEIKLLDAEADFRFWGGDLMAAEGGTLVSHYKERAFMGIYEVLKNIRTISKFLKHAKADIANWKPDALILIDNPGFNLRLAPFAKKLGIPVHYYIAPKVWAWNTGRVKQLRENVDFLYSILPFEPAFFKLHNVNVDYVGNPTVDAISQFKPAPDWKAKYNIQKPLVALLPGSRRQEIESMLPLMAELAKEFTDYEFAIAAAPGYKEEYFTKILGTHTLKICYKSTYDMLSNAHAALVTSGTATLETGAFNVPQVVCYKMAKLTYFIGKMVIKIKYISLVNLILDRALVRELIQHDFNYETLKKSFLEIAEGPCREEMLKGYEELREKLGKPGASRKTAELVVGRTA